MVLKKYRLGDGFVSWIQLLYTTPQVSVSVNVRYLQMFQLGRVVRGPLSPLLFPLCIEPLAQLLRDSTDISGIEVNREEQRLSLYTDDVIVYISNPAVNS